MVERAPWQREAATPIGDDELREFETFLIATVRAAGALTLDHFRQSTAVYNKSGAGAFDPVTEADKAAESLIRERISARFPGHGILGEEHGYEAGDGGLTWVIDPIDGTRSFITGALHWGVLVSLFDGVHPRLGAMYQPFTQELFMGSSAGAWLEHGAQRRALRTRRCVDLSQAVLCCTTPEMFEEPGELQAFQGLAERTRMLRYGGDCYSYCMLAMGLVDLVVESSLHAYDIQALMPIVEAAGGGIVAWDGGSAAAGGAVLAYGDPGLRAPALACLAGQPSNAPWQSQPM